MSFGELAFYRVLLECLGTGYTVFSKVRIRDILDYPNTISARAHLNRVSQKHVDFVICDPRTTRILLVVELDDRSHDQKNRAARDKLVDEAFQAASVPLIHIRARREYNAQDIASAIRPHLTRKSRHLTEFHRPTPKVAKNAG